MKAMTLQEVAHLVGTARSKAIVHGKCSHHQKQSIKTVNIDGEENLVDCAALRNDDLACLHLCLTARGCPFVGSGRVISVTLPDEEDSYGTDSSEQ